MAIDAKNIHVERAMSLSFFGRFEVRNLLPSPSHGKNEGGGNVQGGFNPLRVLRNN